MTKNEALAIFFLASLIAAFTIPVYTAQAQGSIAGANHVLPDGTTSGNGAKGIVRNGNVYTFTENVAGQLIVQRDDIVIDGAGFTLQGNNGRGVDLSDRNNVTVQNVTVSLEGGYSIHLNKASNCKITGNFLTWSSPAGAGPVGPIAINLNTANGNVIENNTIIVAVPGIQLQYSQNNSIIGNTIRNSRLGVTVENSPGNIFRDNRMVNCTAGFSLRTYSAYSYGNDVDTSNTIDGNPIIYWQNVKDVTVPENAAYVALINCTNILAENIKTPGFVLSSCSNCTLSRYTLTGGESITLENCSKITIVECNLAIWGGGMSFDGSSNNVIAKCFFANGSIRMAKSNNNLFAANNFTGNSYAIAPFQDTPSMGNIISGNYFTQNKFALVLQGGNVVSGNYFEGNDHTIIFMGGSSEVTGNTFLNDNVPVTLNTQGNKLRNNTFINDMSPLQISGANFDNDVDASNTVNGKPIYYWVNRHDQAVPSDAGLVVLFNCTGITVRDCRLTNQDCGVVLAYTQNCTLANNLIAGNVKGLFFYAASGNQIVGNNITDNQYAVYISGAVLIFTAGLSYTPSSSNTFSLNNFVNNSQDLYDVAARSSIIWESPPTPSVNFWDNGAAGNFWGSYNGVDSNGDGVGDKTYQVSVNNTDHYPLMVMHPVVLPSLSPAPSPTPSTSPTLEPSLEPTQTATPTNDDNQTLDLTPILILSGIVVATLVVGALIYFRRRKG